MTQSRPVPPSLRRRLGRRLRRFGAEEQGSLSIEFMILLPLLVWAFYAMFTFYDLMRVQTTNQKAAYTIADMLSRETDFITPDYVDNTKRLFDYLAKQTNNTAIRVSSIKYNQNRSRYEISWSQARGAKTGLTSTDIRDWDERLPVIASGDELILVETWNDYYIPFHAVGLEDFTMSNFVYTRPRFTNQLKYAP